MSDNLKDNVIIFGCECGKDKCEFKKPFGYMGPLEYNDVAKKGWIVHNNCISIKEERAGYIQLDGFKLVMFTDEDLQWLRDNKPSRLGRTKS